jgi:hypothetical protein
LGRRHNAQIDLSVEDGGKRIVAATNRIPDADA